MSEACRVWILLIARRDQLLKAALSFPEKM
jgi:hypothetical protein